MIAPVLPYTIQGAIWYQGESNASAAALYRKLFPTMILSWRMAWAKAGLAGSDRPDFPFLFVQLANYVPAKSDPARSEWAELREAQLREGEHRKRRGCAWTAATALCGSATRRFVDRSLR